jgi:hypothetical protein
MSDESGEPIPFQLKLSSFSNQPDKPQSTRLKVSTQYPYRRHPDGRASARDAK